MELEVIAKSSKKTYSNVRFTNQTLLMLKKAVNNWCVRPFRALNSWILYCPDLDFDISGIFN